MYNYKTGFEVIREQLFVISPSLSHRFYFPAEKKAIFRILDREAEKQSQSGGGFVEIFKMIKLKSLPRKTTD